jgi:hypothetical protein
MKLVRRSLLIALILTVAIPLSASAQGPSTYTVGIQIANLDTTGSAAIQITYYNQDGTVATTFDATIAAGGSTTYYPIHAADGFNGSVIISSDKEVAAIANVLGNGGAFGGASYDSFSQGATSANIPLIAKNFYGIYTWFNVQNTGSVDANVTVTYAGSPAPTCTETGTIKPGAAKTFKQQTSSCLSNGFLGAATVTTGGSDQTIAVAVVEHSSQSLLAFDAFATQGSTSPVMPLISHKYYNSRTGIQIMNTGGANTNVTVTYTPSTGFPGTTCSETKLIEAHKSANFGDTSFFEQASLPCGPMSGTNQNSFGFAGSAKVTANSASQNLVAIVNSVTSGTANSAAYASFDASVATNKVNFPLVMDRVYGIFTGFSVANVGTQPTNILCTFGGTSYTASQNNVQPGQSMTTVQLNQISSGYSGAANCTATGGDALIVGVVSELGGQGDKLLYYEGFNY